MKKLTLLLLCAAASMMAIAQNIAVGKSNTLVTSSDGGNTWVNKSPSLPTGVANYDVIGISKYSTNNWVISQYKSTTTTGNYIQRTTDGGSNYTTLATNLNAANRNQAEMAHFGQDTLLLLSQSIPGTSTEGYSVSNLTAGTPTFAAGGTSRAPYQGVVKYNATSALAINNYSSPYSSSSEVYKFTPKSVTAGSFCFTVTASVFEHPQLSGAVRVDSNTLFAVGNVNGASYISNSVSGYLYKSTDNGATWTVVSLPSLPSACGLMAIGISPNKQNIVVAGSKGYVARSGDSGANWSMITPTGIVGTAANWVYNKVAFADDNTVIVGGSDQTSSADADWYSLRSTNGGAAFAFTATLTAANYTDLSAQQVDRRGSYMSIYFVNSTTGYATLGRADAAKKYEIMKTTDAGATWTLLTWASGAKPSVNAVEIINHISNENDLVVNSLSGKNLWQIDVSALTSIAATSIVSKYTAKDLRGTYKKSATELYAIEYATTATEGGIYKSTDGGITWTLATVAANGLPMLCITDGFVTGYLGRAFTANSDFSSLTQTLVLGYYGGQLTDLASTYKGIANTSSSTIYAIGEKGTILKSTNTGVSFSFVGKLEWSDLTYTAISVVDANIVYICGYNESNQGVILKTTNGGADWTRVVFATIGKLNDIQMYNATQGLAVGDGGVLLGTTDGEAWISKSLGITDNLLRVVCDEPVSITGTPEITTGLHVVAKSAYTYVVNNTLNIVANSGARVTVFNLLGMQERTFVMKTNQSSIELTSGTKIVKIENAGVINTSKFIIR